jgi:hypothetical protein
LAGRIVDQILGQGQGPAKRDEVVKALEDHTGKPVTLAIELPDGSDLLTAGEFCWARGTEKTRSSPSMGMRATCLLWPTGGRTRKGTRQSPCTRFRSVTIYLTLTFLATQELTVMRDRRKEAGVSAFTSVASTSPLSFGQTTLTIRRRSGISDGQHDKLSLPSCQAERLRTSSETLGRNRIDAASDQAGQEHRRRTSHGPSWHLGAALEVTD